MGGHCIVNLWKNIMLALCIDCLLFCCSQVMPNIIWCCFTACLLNAKLPNKKDHFTYFDGDRQITVCLSLSLRNCDRKFWETLFKILQKPRSCFFLKTFFSLFTFIDISLLRRRQVTLYKCHKKMKNKIILFRKKKRKHFVKWCEHYKVESNIDLQYFKGRFK